MEINIKAEMEKALNEALESVFVKFDETAKSISEKIMATQEKNEKEPIVKITVKIPKSYRDWINDSAKRANIYQNDFVEKLIEKAMKEGDKNENL